MLFAKTMKTHCESVLLPWSAEREQGTTKRYTSLEGPLLWRALYFALWDSQQVCWGDPPLCTCGSWNAKQTASAHTPCCAAGCVQGQVTLVPDYDADKRYAEQYDAVPRAQQQQQECAPPGGGAQQQAGGAAALMRTDQQTAADLEHVWQLIDAAATSCADAWPTGVPAAGAAPLSKVVAAAACGLVWRQQTAGVPVLHHARAHLIPLLVSCRMWAQLTKQTTCWMLRRRCVPAGGWGWHQTAPQQLTPRS